MQSYTLEDLAIRQYLRPDKEVLGLQGMDIINRETSESTVPKAFKDYTGAASKMFAYMPLVRINYGFELSRPFIKQFSINCKGFLPQLTMTIIDGTGQLRGKYYPRCGSVVNVYIASLGQENYYKPIRADFLITRMSQSNDTIYLDPEYYSQTPVEYRITAVLNIPRLFYKDNMFESGTSFHSLMNLCEELGIGFASNLAPEDFDDGQVWLNNHGDIGQFIQHIASHSYKDEESFQYCFVDLWYNLNFVEVSRLFSQMKDNPECRIYPTTNPEEEPAEHTEEELQKDKEENGSYFTLNEKVYDYQLNNSKHLQAWSLFFTSFTPISDLSGAITDGYKKNICWYDYAKAERCERTIIPFAPETEGMIPVNRGRMNRDGSIPEMVSRLQSYSFEGTLAGQHPNFYVAEVQNALNLSDMDKFGIDLELPCVNPALMRYSRIRVVVMARNDMEKDIITEGEGLGDGGSVETQGGATLELDKYPGLKSDSPADLTDEEKERYGIATDFDDKTKYDVPNGEKLNQALSGFYVVTGYEIFMDGNLPMLRTAVSLRRKELYPPLRSDYEAGDVNGAEKQDAVSLARKIKKEIGL